ncbi:MAG: helix-turn-helix domain-containing protein [Variovorax sp.]
MYPTHRSQADAAQAQPVRLLTKKEVAERLGVSTRTVEIWTKDDNILKPVYPGGGRTPKWHSQQFEEWFDQAHRSEMKTDASEPTDSGIAQEAGVISEHACPPAPVVPGRDTDGARLEPSSAVKRMQAQSQNRLNKMLCD